MFASTGIYVGRWLTTTSLLLFLLLPNSVPITVSNATVTAADMPSPGPIHVTTNATCDNPAVIAELRPSPPDIPDVTVTGYGLITSTDAGMRSHDNRRPTLRLFDANGAYSKEIPFDGRGHPYSLTSSKRDTLKACVVGAHGSETADISYKGAISQQCCLWVGYSSTGWTNYPATFSAVTGTWTQPTIMCSPGEDSAVALWVGLAGAPAGLPPLSPRYPLEQIGTFSECFHGTPHYLPWYEMVPADVVFLGSEWEIRPGDSIQAEVRHDGGRTFSLALATPRSNPPPIHATLEPDISLNDALSSADWILEATQFIVDPATLRVSRCTTQDGRCPLPRLVTGGQPVVSFTNCSSRSGDRIDVGPLTVRFDVLNTSEVPVSAEPSVLPNNGMAFNVIRRHQ